MTYINQAIFDALAYLARQAHQDAKAHGLWDQLPLEKYDPKYVRKRCTLLIREEVCEMYEAAGDPVHYAEELADVVIMCMSAAGHMGIDLAAEIKHKMAVNQQRPYQHRDS